MNQLPFAVVAPMPQQHSETNEVQLVPRRIANLVWATVETLSGNEQQHAGQVVATATHKLLMDAGCLKQAGLKRDGWFESTQQPGRKFMIKHLEDIQEAGFTLAAWCEEVVA